MLTPILEDRLAGTETPFSGIRDRGTKKQTPIREPLRPDAANAAKMTIGLTSTLARARFSLVPVSVAAPIHPEPGFSVPCHPTSSKEKLLLEDVAGNSFNSVFFIGGKVGSQLKENDFFTFSSLSRTVNSRSHKSKQPRVIGKHLGLRLASMSLQPKNQTIRSSLFFFSRLTCYPGSQSSGEAFPSVISFMSIKQGFRFACSPVSAYPKSLKVHGPRPRRSARWSFLFG